MLETMISYIWLYICNWIRYIFVRNYDFIYMIMDNWTMNWFWYLNQWGLFIGTMIPNQCGLFIGTRQWGYSLVFWYPDQWGLFIGTLIPKPIGVIHWYSDTQINGVIHWYSNAQSRGYSVTIVIRFLRIWITFEH